MSDDPQERENLRLVLAAVAMHGLLGAIRPSHIGTQTINYDGMAVADSAVRQADQLLAALEKKS